MLPNSYASRQQVPAAVSASSPIAATLCGPARVQHWQALPMQFHHLFCVSLYCIMQSGLICCQQPFWQLMQSSPAPAAAVSARVAFTSVCNHRRWAVLLRHD